MTTADQIPNTAYFVWLGPDLDWACTLAIRSALVRGGFDRGVLYHEARLADAPCFGPLTRIPGLELRVLDEAALFDRLEREGGPALGELYRELRSPAARVNVIRVVLLWLDGGVYLDLDTLTVRDLGDLRSRCGAFFGLEVIAHAACSAGGARPAEGPRKLALRALRTSLRLMPSGWRHVGRFEHLYPHAANNAVLGSRPRHPFFSRLLRGMVETPPERRLVRFSLGTHLIQRTVAQGVEPDVEVLGPAAFFPLGPVVSEHWFKVRRRIPPLREIVRPDTLVVHWYASGMVTSLLPHIDEAYVRAHRDRQLFSRLACGVIDDDLDAQL